jgi:hypothetical protein
MKFLQSLATLAISATAALGAVMPAMAEDATPPKTPIQLVQVQRDQCLSQNADLQANFALLTQGKATADKEAADKADALAKYWAAYVAGIPAAPDLHAAEPPAK